VVTMVCVLHETDLTKVAYFSSISHSTNSAIAHVARHHLLIMETQVQSRVASCEIYGGQSGTGAGLCPSSLVFPC
jgi:hypothetical protein